MGFPNFVAISPGVGRVYGGPNILFKSLSPEGPNWLGLFCGVGGSSQFG